MQVHQHVHHLPSTWCTPRASSSTAPSASGFTLTFRQGCNIAQAFMHATTLHPRPTCPYYTPSKVVLLMMYIHPRWCKIKSIILGIILVHHSTLTCFVSLSDAPVYLQVETHDQYTLRATPTSVLAVYHAPSAPLRCQLDPWSSVHLLSGPYQILTACL